MNGETAPFGPAHNNPGGESGTLLRTIVERIESLEEERSALVADIREVYSEAKVDGFDVKALRQVIRLRKIEAADRQKQEAILDTYKLALGML